MAGDRRYGPMPRRSLSDTEAIVRNRRPHYGELSIGEVLEGGMGPANPNAGAAQTASTGLRPFSADKNPGVSRETLKGAVDYVNCGIK